MRNLLQLIKCRLQSFLEVPKVEADDRELIPSVSLEQYFTYHPVMTDDRRDAHAAINEGALQFAKVVMANCDNPELQKMAVHAIQSARMFANQGATDRRTLTDVGLME